MIDQPFALFRPHADVLSISMLTKEDCVKTDSEAMTILKIRNAASIKQSHGNVTVVTRDAGLEQAVADGIATDRAGLTLFVRAADCQLFVAYDPVAKITGLLHAGWRGLVAGAIEEFVSTLSTVLSADPARLLVGAAPSLCTKCAEFTDPARELPSIDPRFFHGRNVNLQGIADAEFLRLGILPGHLERHPDCTRCRTEKYWSYRGEGEAVKEGYRNMLICSLRGK
jgi:hypothetical protein